MPPADAQGLHWFFAGLHTAELARRRPFDPDTLARLDRARALLEERLDQPVALDELARAACYSRFHFLRLFQQAYAEPPHRWLAERRIVEARRLLAETDLPVTDISRRVGFRSLGTFSRTFRDRVGEPPIGYRRRIWPSVALRRVAIPTCFLKKFV